MRLTIQLWQRIDLGSKTNIMKTFVLTVSERFPKTHKRAGEQTNFVGKIDSINCDLPFPPYNLKIHTIRANYELWEKRFEQIKNNKAILSVRVWEGKPYNSKQKEVFRFNKANGIGIQKLEWKKIPLTIPVGEIRDWIKIDGKLFAGIEEDKKEKLKILANNDGLNLQDFEDWFNNYDLSNPMAIIHFTDFRYNGL